MSRFSKKARYKRGMIPTVILFVLSVAADIVLHCTLGNTLVTPENFKASFSIYLLTVSLGIGALWGFLCCFATRKSYKARDHAKILAFVRVLIIWIAGLVGTFTHDNWVPQNTLDPSGAVGNVFAFVLIVGVIFLCGQFFLLLGILAIKEPDYDGVELPSVPTSSGGYSGPSYPREKTREEIEFEKFCEIVDNQ